MSRRVTAIAMPLKHGFPNLFQICVICEICGLTLFSSLNREGFLRRSHSIISI
jgi:hypothetical protein